MKECSICAGTGGLVGESSICYQCLPAYIAGGKEVIKQATLIDIIKTLEKMEKDLDEHIQK